MIMAGLSWGRQMPKTYFKPCWSCGAQYRSCYEGCRCEKCLDPEGYKEWQRWFPDEYEEWLGSQREYDEDDDELFPDAPG